MPQKKVRNHLQFVCKDDPGRIHFKSTDPIGNCHILLVETFAIPEAFMEDNVV